MRVFPSRPSTPARPKLRTLPEPAGPLACPGFPFVQPPKPSPVFRN